ncbi:MAG: tetratricopeptide repeat protein [Candidatus Thiodiazotropha lotti]|nr:tetratricopeptide repeat protein [Candidatus Thiodiazotropha lotti]
MIQNSISIVLLLLFTLVITACSTTTRPKAITLLEMADKAYIQGRWAEAEKHYLAITKVASTDFYAWFRLGNARLQQGNIESAIYAYQMSIQRDQKQPKPHHNLAESYLILASQALEHAYVLSEESSYERKVISKKRKQLQPIIYKRVKDMPSPARKFIRY